MGKLRFGGGGERVSDPSKNQCIALRCSLEGMNVEATASYIHTTSNSPAAQTP